MNKKGRRWRVFSFFEVEEVEKTLKKHNTQIGSFGNSYFWGAAFECLGH